MFGWDDIIVGGIGAFANLFGAHKQASAAEKAAKINSESARYAADLQSRAQAQSQAFQEAEARRDQANWEAAQHANYDMYANRYRAATQLGDTIGFHLPDLPAYVPSVASGQGGAPAQAAAPAQGGGGVPKSTGDLNKDLALANQISGGTVGGGEHSDPSYWAKAGYANDPQYFFEKMLGKDATGKDAPVRGPYAKAAGAAAARVAPAYVSNPIAAYLDPALGAGGAAPAATFRLRGIQAYL